MSITVLNNISSIIAENAVSNTQSSLQNTLQQLSTGLKINSGADDPAGLSIAEGLGANIAALTQSNQNSTNGIGLLQTADGALSQVTSVLNQAVAIATEASNGGLSASQSTALNTEFQSILSEINQIGSTTNFNGTTIFGGNALNSTGNSTITSVNSGLLATTALTTNATYTINEGSGNTFSYTAAAGSTVGDLITSFQKAEAGASTGTVGGGSYTSKGTLTGTLALNSPGNLVLTGGPTGSSFVDNAGSATDAVVGGVNAGNNLLTPNSVTTITGASGTISFTAGAGATVNQLVAAISNGATSGSVTAASTGTAPTGLTASVTADGQVSVTGTNIGSVSIATTDSILGTFNGNGGSANVYTSDGTTSGSHNVTTAVGALSANALGLSSQTLSSSTSAQAALTAITAAISTVAAQRGNIGASVNTLTSDGNVETTEVQNLTNAQNNVQNADIASVTSNLTQYNILEQTGFDALSQSSHAEQNVLKLLQ